MGVWSSPQLLRPRRRVWVGCVHARVCMCLLGDMGGRGGSVAFHSSMTIIFVFLYSPVVVVTWFYF